MPPPISSTQALVLMCVTWFIRINRKKGKDYTTITAQQVSDWIAEKFGADVQSKAAQNALRSLTTQGRLMRQDEKVCGWKVIYRYSLPSEDAEVPVVFFDQVQNVPENTENRGQEPGPNRPPIDKSTKGLLALKSQITLSEPSEKKDVVVEMSSAKPALSHPPEMPEWCEPKEPQTTQSTYDHPTERSDETKAPEPLEGADEGVVSSVQRINSSVGLAGLERTLMSRLGAPDPGKDPAGFIRWCQERRERRLSGSLHN